MGRSCTHAWSSAPISASMSASSLADSRLDQTAVLGVGREVLRLARIALAVVEHDVVVSEQGCRLARAVRLERREVAAEGVGLDVLVVDEVALLAEAVRPRL